MYKILDICRHIINYGQNKDDISVYKLMKLLYFVQVEFLVNKKQPCFSDKIEAWKCGPVIYSVLSEYGCYGGLSIPKITRYFEINKDLDVVEHSFDENIIKKDDQKLLNKVVDFFVGWTDYDMMCLIVEQNPFLDKYKKDNKEITHQSLIDFFS